MITLKLRQHKSAQCHVNADSFNTINHSVNGEITFVSYVTEVIKIKYVNGIRYVMCTGTYSQTTRKQIGWFLREYAPDLSYQQMRDMDWNEFICMETGEKLSA